jgi:hypothetical protein
MPMFAHPRCRISDRLTSQFCQRRRDARPHCLYGRPP